MHSNINTTLTSNYVYLIIINNYFCGPTKEDNFQSTYRITNSAES